MARNSSDTSEEIVTESSSSCEDIKAGKNSFIKWTSNLYERFEETQLYRYFYVTGIALVRKAKRIRRRTLRFVRSHRPQIHLSPRHRRILARAKASLECAREILEAGTTDEALAVLDSYGILKETMAVVMEKIQFYLDHRSYEQILLGAVVFSNVYGLLGQTRDAEELIHKIQEQAVRVDDLS